MTQKDERAAHILTAWARATEVHREVSQPNEKEYAKFRRKFIRTYTTHYGVHVSEVEAALGLLDANTLNGANGE